MGRLWTRWAALLALTVMLAACGAAVSQEPAATPGPAPAEPAQVTCDDSAIRLLGRGAGIHGAIVADTLHLGGATAPATCTDPTNESLAAGLPAPEELTAQVQQSEYYLIVIRYTSGNRLYVISLRGDGTACVVDTDDECVAEVTGLPDDFDLDDLPDDVARTIPAGRPAAPDVGPSPPGGDDTPPAAGPAGAASNPQPPDGATGVPVDAPLLSWSAAPGALSYDVHWHIHEPGQTAGINTTSTFFRMSARTSTKATYGETARLQGETTYYWRVDALRGGTLGCLTDGSCTFGQTWSFTTGPMPSTPPPAATGPPRTATNSYPRPGQTGVRGVHRDTTIDTPIAWWTEVPRALSYDVHWSKDVRAIRADNPRAFASTTSIGTSSTSRGMGPLDPETTYYWRVDPKNGAGVTKGNVWWFTTGTLVPPPEEETPLPSLSWVRTPGSRNMNQRSFTYCMLYTIRLCIRDEVVGVPIKDYPSSISSSIDFPRAEPSSGPSSLSYSLSPAIPGLVFNPKIRTLRGTPAPGTVGAYNMTYTAEDADGRTNHYTFKMYIKRCHTCPLPPLRTPEPGWTWPHEAEETPEEERQAPAWPAAAADFKIESSVVGDGTYKDFVVPPPTGNPKPVISIKGPMPYALHVHSLQKLRFGTGATAAKGTMTLVATNSEGRAELEVPYNLTCRYTLAESLEQLRGSWVPWAESVAWKYSAITIGDTITTVPASSGTLDRDYAAEYVRAGWNWKSVRENHISISGHTHCINIYHTEYSIDRLFWSNRWNKSQDPHEQEGCERYFDITPREGAISGFVPAGCESGHSPDGTPD